MRIIRGATAGTVALSALLTVLPNPAVAAGSTVSLRASAQAASAIGTFYPIGPTRIADTRIGHGAPAAIGPGRTTTFAAAPPVTTPNTEALALNVTAVTPTAATYLTVFPTDESRPVASTLNPAKGQTVPNATITWVYPTNDFNVYNNSGSTHLVVDVAGSFEYLPESGRSTGRRSGDRPTLRSSTAPAQPTYRR